MAKIQQNRPILMVDRSAVCGYNVYTMKERTKGLIFGLTFVVLWVGIVIIADLNWPSHMGDKGALLKALGIL